MAASIWLSHEGATSIRKGSPMKWRRASSGRGCGASATGEEGSGESGKEGEGGKRVLKSGRCSVRLRAVTRVRLRPEGEGEGGGEDMVRGGCGGQSEYDAFVDS